MTAPPISQIQVSPGRGGPTEDPPAKLKVLAEAAAVSWPDPQPFEIAGQDKQAEPPLWVLPARIRRFLTILAAAKQTTIGLLLAGLIGCLSCICVGRYQAQLCQQYISHSFVWILIALKTGGGKGELATLLGPILGRLSVLVHVLWTTSEGADPTVAPITEATVFHAFSLALWSLSSYLEMQSNAPNHEPALALWEDLRGHPLFNSGSCSLRDLSRRGPIRWRSKSALDPALNTLVGETFQGFGLISGASQTQ